MDLYCLSLCEMCQDPNYPVAVKCITKRNLMKQADVLNKEVQILKVHICFLLGCKLWQYNDGSAHTHQFNSVFGDEYLLGRFPT